jgi:hypothetical protein
MNSETKSQRGVAFGGKAFDPSELPDENDADACPPRAAPAPGLPISEKEYNRLKEEAEHPPGAREKDAKKDQGKKKGKPGTHHR